LVFRGSGVVGGW